MYKQGEIKTSKCETLTELFHGNKLYCFVILKHCIYRPMYPPTSACLHKYVYMWTGIASVMNVLLMCLDTNATW